MEEKDASLQKTRAHAEGKVEEHKELERDKHKGHSEEHEGHSE